MGWNSRLDELQAAILRVKLGHAAAGKEARRRIAARYGAALAGCPLVLPREPAGARHVFHQYTVRTPRRDALAQHLAPAGPVGKPHPFAIRRPARACLPPRPGGSTNARIGSLAEGEPECES